MSPSPSEGSPESPDSPSGPIPRMPTSPLFKAPPSSSSPRTQSPLSSTADGPSPNPTDAAGPSWSTDAADSPSPAESPDSGTPSTGSGVKLSKAGIRAVIGTGFRRVCQVAAAVLAAEEERAAWMPDTEDVAEVSTPAASLVYRRLPEDARGGDALDVLALFLGVAGYFAKSVAAARSARTARQLQEQEGTPAEQGPTYTAGGM